MKLDLNFELKSIEMLGLPAGSEVAEDGKHAGKILSALLAKATEAENPVKFFDWALSLYKKQPLDLDKSDMELLKKFVKGHRQMFVFAQAQILNKICEASEEKVGKSKE